MKKTIFVAQVRVCALATGFALGITATKGLNILTK